MLQADGKSKVAMEVQRHESRRCKGIENRGLASLAGGRGRVRSRGQERVVRVQVLGAGGSEEGQGCHERVETWFR